MFVYLFYFTWLTFICGLLASQWGWKVIFSFPWNCCKKKKWSLVVLSWCITSWTQGSQTEGFIAPLGNELSLSFSNCWYRYLSLLFESFLLLIVQPNMLPSLFFWKFFRYHSIVNLLQKLPSVIYQRYLLFYNLEVKRELKEILSLPSDKTNQVFFFSIKRGQKLFPCKIFPNSH